MTKHSHYYKDVSHLKVIDVYRVIALWEVTDPCLQHLLKKALCAGGRGHKDKLKDLQDIVDSAQRALDMHIEDTAERVDVRLEALNEAIAVVDQVRDSTHHSNFINGYSTDSALVNPFLDGIVDALEDLKEKE